MKNSIIKAAQIGSSPFDSIRGYRADGSEYWTGRELMRFLGYLRWENFSKTIQKAIRSCENSGNLVSQHFCVVIRKSGGRNTEDYQLSRYACYLVAMCADPEKDEVADAQRYFAIKTREAEVVVPTQNDRIRELELELQLRQAEQKLLDTRHIIVSTCPEPVQQKILGYQVVEKVEYRDRVLHDDDVIRDGTTINKTALCHRYGLMKAGKPQYKQLTQLLEKLPSEAFRLTAAIVENKELDLSFLPQLDRIFQVETRQLNLGES